MSDAFFPGDYRASRHDLLRRCAARGAQLEWHAHPTPGSDGRPVMTDIASFGRADARSVLIVVSGTHGVEGLCGAGVQHALLESRLPDRLGSRVRLVLVHALNPHGFLDLHRTDEQNVDLNRNFLAHTGEYPDDSVYAEVHPWLVPGDWDGPARAAADAALERYVATRGAAALQAAISGGQYTHADGLFYGGRAPTWSNRTWRRILRRQAAAATYLAVLDLHSGLGSRGACELISGARAGTAEFAAAQRFFGDVLVSPGVDSTAPPAVGFMASALAGTVPGVEAALVVAEFGTVPFDQVFAALRFDNWVRARAAHNTVLRARVRSEMEAAFVGRDAAWQDAVAGRGLNICRRVLDVLAAAADTPRPALEVTG
ncbi:MAG TPA: DUF2817 domain-containing protein [Steroidobacteraceae bacterium]